LQKRRDLIESVEEREEKRKFVLSLLRGEKEGSDPSGKSLHGRKRERVENEWTFFLISPNLLKGGKKREKITLNRFLGYRNAVHS